MGFLRSWEFLGQDLYLILETFCPTERCVLLDVPFFASYGCKSQLSSIVNILQLSRQLSVFIFPRNGIIGPTHTCPLYPRPLLSAFRSLKFASSDSRALLAESAQDLNFHLVSFVERIFFLPGADSQQGPVLLIVRRKA